MLVDSHCHLDRLTEDSSGNTATVLNRARALGVEKFLCIATNLDGFDAVMDIAEEHSDVFCSAGVHPLQKHEQKVDYNRLIEQASHEKVLAVGETGLDYYYSPENAELQKESLKLHIRAAREVKKPIIIHTRDAQEDTLSIIKSERAEQVGGILHCFTESAEMAKEAIDLGFYISFSGILTFKTANSLREVAQSMPLDRILIETDCPWLAPVPYRGKENQPAYVVEVAKQLAELHNLSYEEIAAQTTANFYNLFPTAKL
ncbi:MAG: TatD DNase family protein [Enterobacterales bacterium]